MSFLCILFPHGSFGTFLTLTIKFSVHDPTHENRYRLRSVPPDPPKIIFKRITRPHVLQIRWWWLCLESPSNIWPISYRIHPSLKWIRSISWISYKSCSVRYTVASPIPDIHPSISSKCLPPPRMLPFMFCQGLQIESLWLVNFPSLFLVSFSLSIPCTFPVLLYPPRPLR